MAKKKIARDPNEKVTRINREDIEHMGEKAPNLKARTIEQCLNCKKKPDCNGCPRWEVD